jgi:UDP-N-acetylmuramoylalanine--D-glutamate ligase
MDRPVVLIAGGKDKGLDYRPLLPLLAAKATAAVTFGQIGPPLADLFAAAVPAERAGSLADAVARARRLAGRGSVVLFSPGTSSFDMFRSYEHRGDTFREIVHQLR